MHKWCFGLLVLAVIAVAPCASMAAQQSEFKLSPGEWQMRQKTNAGVIRIIADDVNSTSFRAAAEVSSVLSGLEGLRVIPVVGRGSVSNINDLLFLKEIDLAVVQQDVLDQLRSTRAIPALERRVNYVTKLYNEEVHVLARNEIQDISALANRKVSFGPVGGGAAITATALFDKLRIPVEVTNDDADVALMKLKSGEIDAMVYVDGKPVRLFEQLTAKDGVHFLAVPYDRSLYRAYTPSSLTSADYPNLIGSGEKLGDAGGRSHPDGIQLEGGHRPVQGHCAVHRLFLRAGSIPRQAAAPSQMERDEPVGADCQLGPVPRRRRGLAAPRRNLARCLHRA